MGNILDSDAGQRLRRFKGELVIDLYTRSGSFWDAVREIRRTWGLTSTTQLPPPQCHAGWPTGLAPCPRRTTAPPPPHVMREIAAISAAIAAGPPGTTGGARAYPLAYAAVSPTERWLEYINDLHDAVIPEEYRVEGPVSAKHWQVFLANCACYDPPKTELREFTECGGPAPLPAHNANPLEPDWMRDVRLSAPMLASPIVPYVDPTLLQETERWYYEHLIEQLALRLDPHGINVMALIQEIAASPELQREYDERLRRNPLRSVIAPGPHHTQADVLRAYEMIRATQGARPDATKLGIDPLEAVQCAILADDCGWSEPRIAKHYGWPLSPDDYGKPRRSAKVRERLKLGRQLLQARGWRPSASRT